MTLVRFVTCILLLQIIFMEAAVGKRVIIKTSFGEVKGKKLPFSNKDYKPVYGFFGIPFAEPPVGELRFKKPLPAQPWTGVLETTKMSPICVQSPLLFEFMELPLVSEQSEDCLYLNIWSPAVNIENKSEEKAVMVFIHGGGYKTGAASQQIYDFKLMSSLGDVVVVSVNYRLGVLGFLNMGVEDALGNQGLWDQNMALRWVKEHIRNFGGNPDLVTIFGQSAGAMSVGIHLQSPWSQGLFRHAIMQSGGPVNPGLLYSVADALDWGKMFTKEHGCYVVNEATNETDSVETMQCLKDINASTIVESESRYFMQHFLNYANPTIGDEFYPSSDTENLPKSFTPANLMIGVNANEGCNICLITMLMERHQDYEHFSTEDMRTLAQKYLITPTSPAQLLQAAYEFYFPKAMRNDSHVRLKQKSGELAGDMLITCPTQFFAEQFATKNPVYFYQYSHYFAQKPGPEWTGVSHIEELPFVFGLPLVFPTLFDEADKEFSAQLIELWTSFAKTGKSRLPGIDSWPLYSEDSPLLVDLKAKNFTIQTGPRIRDCNFWRCHWTPPH